MYQQNELISSFSIAVIKCCNQKELKEVVITVSSSKERTAHHESEEKAGGMEAWRQKYEVVSLHL